MTHLSDGAIRRLQDEPFALDGRERSHYASCAECRARGDAIAADADVAARALAAGPLVPDAALALTRFHAGAPRVARPRFAFRLPRALVAAVAIVVLAFTLASTGLAESFLKIFEAKQFTPVTVSANDLRGLPDLSAYGTMRVTSAEPEPQKVADVAAARAATGLPLALPATPPANARLSDVEIVARTTATFTFSAARAQANAAKLGQTLPPMPANIDGATLVGQAGPAAAVVYTSATQAGTQPVLIVAEGRAPTVSSDGVTLDQLRDYLLAQPGISPSLAAQIRAIGDPSTTLPIPIPLARANAQAVQVQGVSGLLVGDGIFAGVIWQKDGIVHGVAGTLSADQVLAAANSLR